MKKTRSRKKKSVIRRKKMLINRFAIIFLFLSFLGIVSLGVYGILKSFFTVKNIYANSTTLYDEETIVDACKIKKGEIIFFTNLEVASYNVCLGLPYIDSAKLTKRLPNSINIEVEQAVPYVNLISDDGYIAVSKNNKILEVKESPIPEIPTVVGLKYFITDDNKISYENQALKDFLVDIIEKLKANELFSLEEIDVSDAYNIKLSYANKITIIFGDTKDIDYKIKTIREILFNKLKSDDIGTLDLSSLGKTNKSYFKTNH